MAPGVLLPDNATSNQHPDINPPTITKTDATASSNQPTSISPDKPTVYLLDPYHPTAIEHAQTLFNLILPDDPRTKTWYLDAEYILVRSSYISASDIKAARKLRAIGKQGVGTDRIDSGACRDAGVVVLNTPGVNATAVAELVLALTMSVAREIGSIQVRHSRGEAVRKETCSGMLMTGKTVGVIGMGNIGRAVAKMFRGAFGADVVAYDPFMPEGAWDDVVHTRVQSVEEVLRAADVVSVHVPLTSDTRNLIRLNEMKMMRPSAILINAARGGIVNEDDLCTALSEGYIWGAGIDCHEQEPPTKDKYHKLWSHPRVVSTPHIGAAIAQTQLETAKAAVDRLHSLIVQQQQQ